MADQDLRSDIKAAQARMRTKVGGKREIRKLGEHLWDGETVERITTGYYGKGTGLVVLTDRRLFFIQDGWTSKTTEDFPLGKVSSVQWNSGLLMGTIIVFAAGNKAEIKNVNKDDGKEIVDLMRGRLASLPGGHSAPGTSNEGTVAHSVADELAKLADLHRSGVLTDDEFAAQKARLLQG